MKLHVTTYENILKYWFLFTIHWLQNFSLMVWSKLNQGGVLIHKKARNVD